MQHHDGPSQPDNGRKGYITAACVRFIQKLQHKSEQTPANQNEKSSTDQALVRHARNTAWATIVIAGASILTFGAALLQYFVFSDQLRVMKQADETTREAFTSAQRAFVVVTDLEQVSETVGDRKGWMFNPQITNVGSTSTTNFEFIEITSGNSLQIETNYEWSSERYREACLARLIASPADPDAFFSAKPRRPVGTVNVQINRTNLGPKDFTKPTFLSSNDRFVSTDLFKAIQDKKISPFFYGEIRYNDIFHKTKKHVTKYCYGLFGIRGDGTPSGSPVVSRCSHWNCTDDECEGDRERFDAEIAEAAKRPDNKCP
jgi:hypothetical protein